MNFKLPIYYIPYFQQGGLIFKDNMYTNPVNLQGVAQALARPRSQGYNEQLQNANLNRQFLNDARQGLQQQLSISDRYYRQAQDSFNNQIRQEELEFRRQAHEAQQANNLIALQKDYMDELGFDILATDRDALETLKEKHGVMVPSDINSFGDAYRSLINLKNDKEFQGLLQNSVLQKQLAKELDSSKDLYTKIKSDPTKAKYFDIPTLDTEIAELTKAVADFREKGQFDEISGALAGFGTKYSELGQQLLDAELAEASGQAALKTAQGGRYEIEAERMQIENDIINSAATPEEKIKLINQIAGDYPKGEKSLTESQVKGNTRQWYQNKYGRREGNIMYERDIAAGKDAAKERKSVTTTNNIGFDKDVVDIFNKEFKDTGVQMYIDDQKGMVVIQNAKGNKAVRSWLESRGVKNDQDGNDRSWLTRWIEDNPNMGKFLNEDLYLYTNESEGVDAISSIGEPSTSPAITVSGSESPW